MALAIAASAASPLYAAGLGRLTVQSALGQPLRAEVEVTSLSKDEAGTLAVKLATPDAFKQAGLEYNPALTSLRFAVDRRPDGRALVRITSNQPLNEPFVDLLIELNWATGKFVREYTFLLDPPELKLGKDAPQDAPAAAKAVVPPAAEAAPVQAAPVPAPAQAAQPQPSAAAPAQPAASPPARSAAEDSAPRRVTKPAPVEPKAAPAPAAKAPAGNVVVQPGETLGIIAGRVKPQSVSLDQAIVAIYRANPNAFFGSVHQLKSGASLAVPDEGTISSVDPIAAHTEIKVQAADFANYKARLAAAARSVPAVKAGQTASGSVSASVEDQGQPKASRDQLKLSKSEVAEAGTGNSAAAAGSVAPKGGAAPGAERRVASDNAVREAQSRVTELEKNVSDLQKLLELKNKQLADLQKQVDSSKAAGASAAGTVGKFDSKPIAVAPIAPKAEAPKVETPKAEPPKAEVPKVEMPKVEAPKAEAPKVEMPKAEAPKTDVAKVEAPAGESGGLLDDLLSNPLVLPGLGAILALGAGYGWYAMRRRKKEEKFEDSLIAAEAFTANSLFGSTGGQSVDTHNSVFTSSSRDSTADVHSTEVDPIAEAEVYIAYGREAQAEEILKEALKKQPERQAIRLKLLEIYSGRKDAKTFAAIASEMYGMTGGQNEEWPKVVTLGLAIDADNPLYTGKAAGDAGAFGVDAPAKASAPAAVEHGGLNGGDHPTDHFHPSSNAAGGLGAAAGAAAMAGLSGLHQDAHFGARETVDQSSGRSHGFVETQPMAGDLAQATLESNEVPSLDFDLDLDEELSKPAVQQARDGNPRAEATTDLSRAIDGKFDLPSLDLPGHQSAAGKDHGAEHTALADLGDLKIDLPALEGLETRRADEPSAIDLSAIGLDLQPSTIAPPPNADAARWQEMATKLDLASAYEEIGDKEGARELLQEVVKGGDNDQQQKARSMLSKIS